MDPVSPMNHYVPKRHWVGDIDPFTVGIETILAIANFLEVEPDDFGPIVAQRRRQVVALARGERIGAGAGGRGTALMFDDDDLVGLAGFEPAASCSQSRRATAPFARGGSPVQYAAQRRRVYHRPLKYPLTRTRSIHSKRLLLSPNKPLAGDEYLAQQGTVD